jgi:uncharacterized protein YdaU (DUF1376 family)
MTNLPWMQIYIGDELAETSALSPEEYGCHMRLRLHQWQHSELPTEDDRLRRICHAEKEHWPSIRDALAPLFGWQWHHTRTAELRLASEEKREKMSQNGRLGGRPKKPMESQSKAIGKANGKADGKPNETPSPSPSPSPSPLQLQSASNPEPELPPEDSALDKGREDTYTRPLPKPKTLEEGKTILISRGCPPEELKKCLDMYMAGHLTLYDIEPWDTEARASA